MADLERVIMGLKYLHDRKTWKEGPMVWDDKPQERRKITADAIALLKAQEPIEARLHLCESCAKEYPECDATVDGIEFGSGVGNDNVIGCMAYVNRWKARTTDAQEGEKRGKAD